MRIVSGVLELYQRAADYVEFALTPMLLDAVYALFHDAPGFRNPYGRVRASRAMREMRDGAQTR